MKGIIALLLMLVLGACGGGGGGGSAVPGVPPVVVTPPVPETSISASASTLKLESLVGLPASEYVTITFKGAGVVAGYPPGAENTSMLEVVQDALLASDRVRFKLSSKAILAQSSWAPRSTVLRFVTGNADGTGVKHTDVTVTLSFLEGLVVTGGPNEFVGQWQESVRYGTTSFTVWSGGAPWSSATQSAWIKVSDEEAAARVSVDSAQVLALPVGTHLSELVISTKNGKFSEKRSLRYIQEKPSFSAGLLDDALNQRLYTTRTLFGNHGALPNALTLYVTSATKVPIDWKVSLAEGLRVDPVPGKPSEFHISFDAQKQTHTATSGETEVRLHAQIPGATLEWKSKVNLRIAERRMYAARGVLGFWMTNTDGPQQALVRVDDTANLGVPSCAAASDRAWLSAECVAGEGVRLQFDPRVLPEGFHRGQISLQSSEAGIKAPATFEVQVYKRAHLPEQIDVPLPAAAEYLYEERVYLHPFRPAFYYAGEGGALAVNPLDGGPLFRIETINPYSAHQYVSSFALDETGDDLRAHAHPQPNQYLVVKLDPFSGAKLGEQMHFSQDQVRPLGFRRVQGRPMQCGLRTSATEGGPETVTYFSGLCGGLQQTDGRFLFEWKNASGGYIQASDLVLRQSVSWSERPEDRVELTRPIEFSVDRPVSAFWLQSSGKKWTALSGRTLLEFAWDGQRTTRIGEAYKIGGDNPLWQDTPPYALRSVHNGGFVAAYNWSSDEQWSVVRILPDTGMVNTKTFATEGCRPTQLAGGTADGRYIGVICRPDAKTSFLRMLRMF